jgi:hypothetical protein
MKMMSWSRYHALSWSVVRVRTHPRHGGVKRLRHPAKAVVMVAEARANRPGKSTAALRESPGRRSRARILRSIIKIFRTRVLPGKTDI